MGQPVPSDKALPVRPEESHVPGKQRDDEGGKWATETPLALAISEGLAKSDPNNAVWQRDLSISYEMVGNVLQAQGNLTEALQFYRDSLAIRDRLATTDRNNAGAQSDLSFSYDRVGEVLVQQGLAEALQSFRNSLVIRDGWASADPSNAIWQRDLALSYGKVGSVLAQQGEATQALDELRHGRTIIARLVGQSPENAQLSQHLPEFDAELAKLRGECPRARSRATPGELTAWRQDPQESAVAQGALHGGAGRRDARRPNGRGISAEDDPEMSRASALNLTTRHPHYST